MVSISFISFALFTLNIFSGECRVPPVMSESLTKEEVNYAIPYPETSSSTDSLRCGEVMTETIGLISYKIDGQALLENERCIWTVAVPNAQGYRVYPALIGFEDDEKLLTISGFTHRFINVTNLSVVNEGLELVLQNVNVLVITFSSDNMRDITNFRGFSLLYVSTQDGNTPTVNPNSRHEILGPGTSHLRHPISGPYQNHEMSTFVFPPPQNVQENRKRNIILNNVSFENSYDYLDVFHFMSSSNQWIFDGRIYNNARSSVLASNDAILVIFSSDVDETNDGFDLSTAPC